MDIQIHTLFHRFSHLAQTKAVLDTPYACSRRYVCVCAWTSIHLLAFRVHLCVHEECQAYLTLTSHILRTTMLFLNMVEAED